MMFAARLTQSHHRLLNDPLDSMLRHPKTIVVRPRLALELLHEALLVPDIEIVDSAEHADIADNGAALPQMGGDPDPPLRIELDRLAEVIHAIEKLQPRGMIGRHER